MRKQGHEQARSSCRWALPFQVCLFWNISTEHFSLTWPSLPAHFPVTFLVATLVCQSLLPVWTPSASRLFCCRCTLLHSTFFWRFSSSTKDLSLSMLPKISSWHAHNQHSQSQPNLVSITSVVCESKPCQCCFLVCVKQQSHWQLLSNMPQITMYRNLYIPGLWEVRAVRTLFTVTAQ